MLNFIRTSDGFTTIVGNKAYTVSKDHVNYNKLLGHVRTGDGVNFIKDYNYVEKVVNLKPDGIYIDGHKLHTTLGKRVVEMIREGFDVEPMKKFLENLLKNPSEDARNELYDFLENKSLPITPDGCFLAYKVVSQDWYSKTGGTMKLKKGKVREDGRIYNGVGQVIECERVDVDSDRRRECSNGLHVGSFTYSGPGGSFYSNGDRVIIVKVNPKDAVAVPKDYNFSKMRVCGYEVVSEYKMELTAQVHNSDGTKAPTERDVINPRDVVEEDVIRFDYTKSDGSKSVRVVKVENVYSDRVQGIENYEAVENWGDTPIYKTFLFSGMGKVTVL